MHRFQLPALVLALTPSLALAQIPAPQSILTALELRAATVQDLALPATPGAFSVSVVLDGQLRTLQVQPKDVRSADFKLLVDDGNTITEVPAPPSITYQGDVLGSPNARVAASLYQGQLEADVHLPEGVYHIEPAARYMAGLPAATHVVYRKADMISSNYRCGVDDNGAADPLGGHDHGVVGTQPANSTLLECEIAFDATQSYYQANGSSTTNTQNAITSVANAMDVIYVRDVTVTYVVTSILVRTTRTYNNINSTALLSEFSSRWRSNHGSIRRDVAHLMAGSPPCSSQGCTLGVANLGAICGTSRNYSVNWARGSGSGRRNAVSAHELGHNWNASHCNSSNPCHLMCSAIWSCSSSQNIFSPVSIQRILNYKNNRGCLSVPGFPPVVSSDSPSSITSWNPAPVTVTGDNLDTTSSVTLDGQFVPFSVNGPTSLTVLPPAPFEIKTHQLTVTNSKGTASSPLTVTGNHPGVLVAPVITIRGLPAGYRVHSDANWLAPLFVSTSNAPSAIPGIVNLGIGNSFTNLIEVTTLVCDNTGKGEIQLVTPVSVPTGTIFHWQAIPFGASISFPLEVTNVVSASTL